MVVGKPPVPPVLAPELTGIPRAIACKYAGRARDQRITLEDLESLANVTFAEALAAWDEGLSPQGPGALGPYLVQRVEWKVRNYLWQPRLGTDERILRSCLSIKDVITSHEEELLGGEDPWDRLDRRLDAQATLCEIWAIVTPRQRELLEAILAANVNLREAARHVGCSHQRLYQVLDEVRQHVEQDRRTRRGAAEDENRAGRDG